MKQNKGLWAKLLAFFGLARVPESKKPKAADMLPDDKEAYLRFFNGIMQLHFNNEYPSIIYEDGYREYVDRIRKFSNDILEGVVITEDDSYVSLLEGKCAIVDLREGKRNVDEIFATLSKTLGGKSISEVGERPGLPAQIIDLVGPGKGILLTVVDKGTTINDVVRDLTSVIENQLIESYCRSYGHLAVTPEKVLWSYVRPIYKWVTSNELAAENDLALYEASSMVAYSLNDDSCLIHDAVNSMDIDGGYAFVNRVMEEVNDVKLAVDKFVDFNSEIFIMSKQIDLPFVSKLHSDLSALDYSILSEGLMSKAFGIAGSRVYYIYRQIMMKLNEDSDATVDLEKIQLKEALVDLNDSSRGSDLPASLSLINLHCANVYQASTFTIDPSPELRAGLLSEQFSSGFFGVRDGGLSIDILIDPSAYD